MDNETAYTILNKLMEFEDILINAASRELPHMVANYLYELASLFHSYYSKEKIVTEDIEYQNEKKTGNLFSGGGNGAWRL